MLGDIILYLTLALPLILGVGFRVSFSHLFFSLMAGELLGRYFGHDLDALARTSGGYGEILLVLLPMFATAYLLRFTVSKRRLMIHLVPLAVMGIICAAFVLPVLPEFLREAVRSVWLGEVILTMNRAIVGGMVAIQLVALWLMHRRDAAK